MEGVQKYWREGVQEDRSCYGFILCSLNYFRVDTIYLTRGGHHTLADQEISVTQLLKFLQFTGIYWSSNHSNKPSSFQKDTDDATIQHFSFYIPLNIQLIETLLFCPNCVTLLTLSLFPTTLPLVLH